jgi:nucleoside diphosphate kinase
MKTILTYLKESLHKPAEIFIIIKPGFFQYTQDILNHFAEDGWRILKQRSKKLLLKEAQRLYKIHENEDFYEDLCKYMSSDITTAFILRNDNKEMSNEIFKETSALKDEIRKMFGESDMRNVIHSSDSLEHMIKEKAIYF